MFVSSRTAYLRNIFTAGEASVLECSATPMVIREGGSTGSIAMLQMCFSVMRRFITLMPRPCSTMDMAEKLSMVVKRMLGTMPLHRNRASTSSSQPSAGMIKLSRPQFSSG